MANDIGLFQQLWRFFTFYKIRKSLGLARAADRQFTSSAQGIADAHDIFLMEKQKEARDFLDALSGLALAIESKRGELSNLHQEKATLLKKRSGCAAVIEQQQALLAKASPEDKVAIQNKIDKAKIDGQGFSARLRQLDAQEPELSQFISAKQRELGPLEARRKKMLEEIKNLPARKAEAVAKFITNKQLLDAYDRINGLTSPADRGPLDAVEAMLRQQDAKVKVSGQLAADASDTSGDEYLEAGSQEAGGDDFDAFLQARRVERQAKTGEPAAQTVAEERPQI